MQTELKELNFLENGKILSDSPKCYLSLLSAGSMRFRWNEKNQNRENFIQKIQNQNGKIFVPVELNHTKDVFDVKNADDTNEKVGDGIITINKNLIPCVTVADCVPIYFFDRKSGVFGIVHSGWKGTGIIKEAIMLANQKYGSVPSDFCVVIGPHINDCCYVVNEERATYFANEFTPDCVKPISKNQKIDWNNGEGQLFSLSLLKANLSVLEKIGVKDSNIAICSDCTCCNQIFGSNRRETSQGNSFTVQAAFIYHKN
jgi:YfiH family protein